jgi:hypothetical protein
MNQNLRFALLDLIWAGSLDALQRAYRQLEDKSLTAHERETIAIVFNQLVHHWAINEEQLYECNET